MYAIIGAAVLFTGLLVLVVGFSASKTHHAFPERCAELGLRQSRQLHCVGTVTGRDVVLGYYGGSRNLSRMGTGAGVLVIVRSGVLPGGGHGANLSVSPPKIWGKGEGGEAVKALLTPEVLDAAEGLEDVTLFPANDLVQGSLLDLVIRDGWPGGWDGLAVRAVIPTDADADAMAAAIRQLATLAERLESRAQGG